MNTFRKIGENKYLISQHDLSGNLRNQLEVEVLPDCNAIKYENTNPKDKARCDEEYIMVDIVGKHCFPDWMDRPAC
jgi:hypothetical protein